jgi:glycosyltransferase 2 family protein
MGKKVGAILTAIIIVLLFFTLKDINFREVYLLLKQIKITYFLLASASYFIFLLIWNIRWKYTMKGFIDAKFFHLLKVLFAGTFLNTITPGTGIGGEPIRAYYLKKKYKKPKTKFLGYILADKTFNLLGFLIYLIFSLISINLVLNIALKPRLISTSAVIIILMIAILFILAWKHANFKSNWLAKKLFKIRSIKKKFKKREKFKLFVEKRVKNLASSMKDVFKEKKKVYFGIGTSLLSRLFEFLAAYLIFLSLGVEVNFIAVITVVTISTLLGDISPTPGGIGIVEGSMILLYTAVGLPAALAATAALLTRVVYYLLTIGLGGLSLLWLRTNSK